MPGKSAPPAEQKPALALLRAALRRTASLHLAPPGRPCELEILHAALFALGLLAGGGCIPGAALLLSCAGLAIAILPRLDAYALWRRERRFAASCSREMVLATLAIYADSVAVYMVAVLNGRRLENIELQDNVRLLLEGLFRACPSLEAAFLRLPALYAEEAIFYAAALCLLAAARGAFSILASVARLARALRWCRLLRIACYASTVLPSQTRNCFVNRFDETYSVSEHWREALLRWRAGGGCNDLVFSGHLVVLGLCGLFYSAHSCLAGAEGGWLSAFVWCRVAHAALRIVYGHFHMSVDLVVSLLVTCFMWRTLSPPEPDEAVVGGADGFDFGEDELEDMDECSDARPWSVKAHGWPAALLLTAVGGFGLLAASPGQAGPLSDYNRQRLRLIDAADPAAGSPSGAASLVQQRRRPRLLCAMLHIEEVDSVRRKYASAVSETWGRHCDGLLLWDERRGDIAPLDLEAAKEEPATDSPPSDRWLRARRMWRYIGRHALPRYDYVAAVDDGGFVFSENLLRVVQAQEGTQKHNRSLFLIDSGSWAPWGYVLSAAAVRELLQAMDGHVAEGAPGGQEACPVPSRAFTASQPAEYETVARCLQRARGIAPSAWDEDPAVREALGCTKGDRSVVNLKSLEESSKLCRHAVLAYMVPQPGWLREISSEVYGARASSRQRQGEAKGLRAERRWQLGGPLH